MSMNLDRHKIDFEQYFEDVDERFEYLERTIVDLQNRLIQFELMNQTMSDILINKDLLTDDEIKDYFSKLIKKVYKKKNKKQIAEETDEAEKNYRTWLLNHYGDFAKS